MKPLHLILSFAFILTLTTCSKTTRLSQSSSYEEIAEEKFGGKDFTCSENAGLSMALCKNQIGDPDLAFKSWEYFVFNKRNGKIILSETIDKGNVKWFSDHEIEISKIPGTMAEGQTMDDYAWIVNVEDGTRIKKSEYNKTQKP